VTVNINELEEKGEKVHLKW